MAKEEIHRIPYNPPDANSSKSPKAATARNPSTGSHPRRSQEAPNLSLRFARLQVVFLALTNDEDAKHTIGLLMISRYAGGAKGAREAARAGAAVIVVDAFRASATICVLASKGARVVPLASVEEAKVFPADFRIGERGGAKVAGFDFGNSPTALRAAELPPESTVAMTTTNGTRVVEAAEGSPEILVGSFVNASAVAGWIADSAVGEVVVVGCGWRGQRASEDEAAAAAILERLRKLGASLDGRASQIVEEHHRRPRESLTKNAAARRLKRLVYEDDIAFCLAEDAVPVVPVLADGAFVGGRSR